MRHPERLWIFVTVFLVLNMVIIPVALAQPTGSENDPPESAESTEETASETSDPEEVTLPADVPTQELFSLADEDTPTPGLTVWDVGRALLSLAIVLVIIWGISLIFKKFITVRGLASSSESLKILYTLSLSPTRTLYMVRLSDRILLIGAGEGGLRTLAEITDPEEVSLILRDVEFKGNFEMNPFRNRLESLMGENIGDSGDADDLDKRQRKLKGTMDRLKNTNEEES